MMLICVSATACAARPPLEDKGLAIQIPRDCEELAQQVPEPEWRKGQSAKVLLGRTTVALDSANLNLAATRNCQSDQRETFARSKPR